MRLALIAQFLIYSCFISFVATDISYAAPILYRVQMQKAMKQRQEIQVKQVIEARRHVGIIIDEEQRPPTYQEMVDRRNQAIAQAILNAHNQSGAVFGNNSTGKTLSPSLLQWIIAILRYLFELCKHFIDGIIGQVFIKPPAVLVQQQTSNSGAGHQEPVAAPAVASDTNDVVDISEVWKKLDKKAIVWTLLSDDNSKLMTVSEYIDRFQKQGAKISQPPVHYVQVIDQIAHDNPQMLQKPFGELLQILAIVDYDFDNGTDRDALAKVVLGEAGYESNKKRFAQPQPQPQQ